MFADVFMAAGKTAFDGRRLNELVGKRLGCCLPCEHEFSLDNSILVWSNV